ncbi:hypothetical protein FGADI_6872 [Fusarium gaditjirri]|uniref:Uncharacterized protein n=1 Tax=Fusarium gaditjirri TaxID=282569 RepID=A0A8H4T6F5_9HYPO|nr:hypothetical protein FGADI_6872 [Fusarium gaditjirri]
MNLKGLLTENHREEFEKESFILYIPPVQSWGTSQWSKSSGLVWSHGVELPRKHDISQQYPNLKSFFVGRLEIPELTMEALQKQVLEVAADAPADETFTPLSHLNILIQNLVELIDPGELISKPILPILEPSGELKRACCATDFFIVDDLRLFKLFRDKVNMLAFTSSQVMRLKSLFKWLGMGKKYLTRNVKHTVEWPFNRIPHEIEWDIGQKAEALLRIAAYFRSRQTRSINARNLILRSLRAAKMTEVKDMFSETKLGDGRHKPDNPGIYIKDTYPQLKLANSGSWQESALVAYVPADEKQRQLAMTVALPRLLMDWLMTGREAYGKGFVDVPDLGVNLAKSVLSAPPELANDILEAEGIEQPLTCREDRHPEVKEECLDQTEAQEAEAPLQTTRTPTSTTPEPVPAPEVSIPLADSSSSQTTKVKQTGTLDAFLGIVPVTGISSGRQRQKRRRATRDSASPGSPPPLSVPKKLRKE